MMNEKWGWGLYGLITNDPGMEHNRVIPLLLISSAEDQGRIGQVLRFLQQHRDKFQRYLEIKILDVHSFSSSFSPCSSYINSTDTEITTGGQKYTQGIPYHVNNTNMNGIFGRNPPFSTIFVPEQRLYKL